MKPSTLKKAAGVLAAVAGLQMAAPAGAAASMPGMPDLGPVAIERHDSGLPADWMRKSVFMEILVRAYQDSNGDGVGDLPGLIRRLDYLKSLGVGALWLLPIYPSADRDHGYAVTNYRDVAPEFGSLADLDRLVQEAHRRGIAVILDYVINHSADSLPLFEAAKADPASPWRDWYVWSAAKPEGWTTYGGDPWHAGAGGYYYAAFSPQMPDFNFHNPAVLEFHLNNLKFWLNRGIDGFRFDAVGALVENGPLAWENQPENLRIMASIRALVEQYGKRYMVAEVPGAPAEFAAADSAGSAFAFGLQHEIVKSAQLGRVQPGLLDYLKHNPVERMGTFLANHDSFAGARLAQQFDGDEAANELAAATLLTLPGIPFLYYGEEIGQGPSEAVQYEDQRLRGPMSWDGSGAGFSAGKPFRPLADNAQSHNVASEDGRADSLLNRYRALIRLRREQPALSIGTLQLLSNDDDPALVFERSLEKQRLLVAINYSSGEVPLKLPAGRWRPVHPAPAAGLAIAAPLRLAPQQVAVFKSSAE
ncbi:alpha-amylase family glycosyl hydrolase [Pseudogulbenkiania ferrooxidans]|uniref:Alpha amylase catalytic region n=1 Tax=Pseudogulbenkiania ferrooxidans 2002 TaxID=279714 RepID=B9Z806_9NEIS|nr:alpha-amylase family glycosyl hydrolase [Pseudogulbenkiania ferrooxidans]EEG07061.1 alpha amylase catalytic region [Pseudogulbenkiania ferrooxidans 2002]